MIVDAISFGNQQRVPANHEEIQNKALLSILKHWEKTGNYGPAKIDYFEGREPKITYLNEVPKSNKFSSIFKNVLKRIFK